MEGIKITNTQKEPETDRKNQTSLFTKIVSVATGVGFLAVGLPVMLRGAPEPPTLFQTLQQSYQQCQTIEDKDWQRELPLGEYTCREVEDLYFKVKY